MLESTFFATQSSFHAMVGVAEQMGTVKTYMSQMFSLVSIYKFVKKLIYRIRGKPLPPDSSEITAGAFNSFSNSPPPINLRPLMFFISFAVGLPWLMSKFIHNVKAAHPDPSDLDFAKVKYEFRECQQGDLDLKQGDIVAILSRVDPQTGALSEWWQGRTQDGRTGICPSLTAGIFPGSFVEVIARSSGETDTSV